MSDDVKRTIAFTTIANIGIAFCVYRLTLYWAVLDPPCTVCTNARFCFIRIVGSFDEWTAVDEGHGKFTDDQCIDFWAGCTMIGLLPRFAFSQIVGVARCFCPVQRRNFSSLFWVAALLLVFFVLFVGSSSLTTLPFWLPVSDLSLSFFWVMWRF